jgi:ABC-type branched-subunit amino acid transport system ATPase component
MTGSHALDVAISVRGLTKRYGDVEVLRGIDLEIRRGELLAIVGPNGAGKTTMVEILEGYRLRDRRNGDRSRRRSGVPHARMARGDRDRPADLRAPRSSSSR